MEVTKGNKLNMKRLYHIQSEVEWSDEPYDMFVWADHFPTPEEVKKLYLEEFDDPGEVELGDFMNSYNVYTVYAEEI